MITQPTGIQDRVRARKELTTPNHPDDNNGDQSAIGLSAKERAGWYSVVLLAFVVLFVLSVRTLTQSRCSEQTVQSSVSVTESIGTGSASEDQSWIDTTRTVTATSEKTTDCGRPLIEGLGLPIWILFGIVVLWPVFRDVKLGTFSLTTLGVKKDVKKVQGKVAEVQDSVTALERQNSDLKSTVEALNGLSAEIKSSVAALESQSAEMKESVEKTQRDVEDLSGAWGEFTARSDWSDGNELGRPSD